MSPKTGPARLSKQALCSTDVIRVPRESALFGDSMRGIIASGKEIGNAAARTEGVRQGLAVDAV